MLTINSENLDTFLEDRDSLARQVDRWFRQATNRFAAPSDSGCRMVAFYIMVLRGNIDDKSLDRRKLAIKYGQLFLSHIEPEHREIDAMVSLASRGQPYGNWFEEAKETLCHIEEVKRHIEALLPVLRRKPEGKPGPIRKLAEMAQEVWAEANDGRAPHSKIPDGPLCRFLVPALRESGHAVSPETVSAVLRGRRR